MFCYKKTKKKSKVEGGYEDSPQGVDLQDVNLFNLISGQKNNKPNKGVITRIVARYTKEKLDVQECEMTPLWVNTRPNGSMVDNALKDKGVLEKKIVIKEVLSKEMLPAKGSEIAKFVVSSRGRLFTMSAAPGVRRDMPRAYTHPSMVGGESVLTAGWIYPDPENTMTYIFTNLTGHYKVNLKSLNTLKPILHAIGLSDSDYRFVEFSCTALVNVAELAIRDPKWSLPSPIIISNNEDIHIHDVTAAKSLKTPQ